MTRPALLVLLCLLTACAPSTSPVVLTHIAQATERANGAILASPSPQVAQATPQADLMGENVTLATPEPQPDHAATKLALVDRIALAQSENARLQDELNQTNNRAEQLKLEAAQSLERAALVEQSNIATAEAGKKTDESLAWALADREASEAARAEYEAKKAQADAAASREETNRLAIGFSMMAGVALFLFMLWAIKRRPVVMDDEDGYSESDEPEELPEPAKPQGESLASQAWATPLDFRVRFFEWAIAGNLLGIVLMEENEIMRKIERPYRRALMAYLFSMGHMSPVSNRLTDDACKFWGDRYDAPQPPAPDGAIGENADPSRHNHGSTGVDNAG